MRIPPPLCSNCIVNLERRFAESRHGLLLAYCVHHDVLARLTIADHVPVHWVADHPVTAEAAEAELAASRREAHRQAN